MLNVPKAKEALKSVGLRYTKQRKEILELLENNYNHPTAEEIINKIEKKFGHVTVATVYNTLDCLSKQGLIKRIDGLENKHHYDPNIKPHFHAICLNCKKIFDVELGDEHFNLPEGFTVKDCVIQGQCDTCKK